MRKDVSVGELRLALDGESARVTIDEKERRLRRIAPYERVHDDVVGRVETRHEPLLAVDDVAIAVARRSRADEAGVRTGVGLGDRHAGSALAETAWHQEITDLFGAAVLQRDGRMPDHRPQRARCLAQLFVDQRLLQLRAALAADVARVVDPIEAVSDHRFTQRLLGRVRQRTVELEVELLRKENAFGKGLCTALPGAIERGKGQVHCGSVRQPSWNRFHSASYFSEYCAPCSSLMTSILRTFSGAVTKVFCCSGVALLAAAPRLGP